ncbi:hypothetical protein HND97_11590 [Vibrio cholerae]|nr:hypothetical protein HND97_11590 [Vibrio cholerae]
MFFLGITAGRSVCGVIAERLEEESMVRGGIQLIVAGVVGLLLPVSASFRNSV